MISKGQLLHKAAESRPWLRLERTAQGIYRRMLGTSIGTREDRHILVPTVGLGNIGDQAMLEAFLRNVDKPVTVIVPNKSSFVWPHDLPVRVAVVPDLLAAHPVRRARGVRQAAAIMQTHSSLTVVGADIMDGAYSRREAVLRYSLLKMGNDLGLGTRVLGFSWSEHRDRAVRSALLATQPETLLMVRDTVSMERLRRAAGAVRAEQVSDSAFACQGIDEVHSLRPWLDRQSSMARPLVVLNVSGLLARRVDLSQDYRRVMGFLQERNCAVIVLPHVIRSSDNDLEAALQVVDPRQENIYVVDELLSPRQVSWVAGQSRAVITGRMHLAVLSLSQGVPPLVLGSQGKVEGMLAYFGLDALALEPLPSFSGQAIPLIGELLESDHWSALIASRLPHVRSLAARNFKGL